MPRFQTNPLGNFSDSNVQTGGRRRLIRHGPHEHSLILEPCSPWLEQGSTIKITRIWEKHQKNSLNITTVHNISFNHIKIDCFSARENWETVETPVDSDIMDLYGLFLLWSPSLFGAMSDLPVETPTAKDRYLCKILDLGQNSTNKKCIVDVFFEFLDLQKRLMLHDVPYLCLKNRSILTLGGFWNPLTLPVWTFPVHHRMVTETVTETVAVDLLRHQGPPRRDVCATEPREVQCQCLDHSQGFQFAFLRHSSRWIGGSGGSGGPRATLCGWKRSEKHEPI